jgi:nicotinamidase-related amidase
MKHMNRWLFVIDYQNDFVDGALGFPGAEKLDGKIAAKIREYGPGRVIFTRDTHFENYLSTREGRNLPVIHCVKGTPGWECYGETAKALAEVGAPAIDKLSFGMDVSDPAVAAVLPEKADEIELVGLVSNICVVSNAVALQSKYPEATIIVDASCTDSFDKGLHEKVLDVLEGFQVKVTGR